MVAKYREASAQLLCCPASALYSRVAFPGLCAPRSGLPPSSRRILVAMAADSCNMVSDQAPRCYRPDSRLWCESLDDMEHEGVVRIR